LGFPFIDVARSVLQNAPQVIFNPGLGDPTARFRFVFYWTMVFFAYTQYRKTARMQAQLYGTPRRNPLGLTVLAGVEGLIVGLIGSYLMTFFGVSFTPDGGGLVWVLVTAFALMLLDARLMCFSYAGGLVSLSYLLLGYPKVSVPALMGLVAILHLMESLLIFLNGSAGATPVYLEQSGRPVGAFYLQRAWPVPVAILILAVVSPLQASGGIGMPDWWPLLRTSPEILAHPGAAFFIHALPAALGYSDLAVTVSPKAKTRRTALHLAAYSLVLLVLAIGATHFGVLVWVTALFSPLGHEAIVRLGSRQERRGRPYFVPVEGAVMVLDVIPRSLAHRLGLGPGWLITDINGQAVRGRDDLDQALEAAGQAGRLEFTARPPAFDRRGGQAGDGLRRFSSSFEPGAVLGVIPVPEPGDDMGLTLKTASPIRALLRKLFKGASGK